MGIIMLYFVVPAIFVVPGIILAVVLGSKK